ncbi:MAG: hypothetical protein IKP50_06505 [Bacilli bacterium]|nr:hypothetical protein [Bacilli bacterium]
MKKLVKILLPFLVVSSTVLSGCKKKEVQDNRIQLDFGDVHATTYKNLSSISDLEKLTKDDKESFLLVVNSTTCTCWNDFQQVLNSYITKNKVICYQMDFSNFENSDIAIKYDLTMLTKSSTTFAIFEQGKLKTTLNTSNDQNIMYDDKKFSQYMNETVKLPGCYLITKDDYYTIKSAEKSAVIYFERTECGDCTALNPGLLHSYVKNHKMENKIYVLDCHPYWRAKSDEDYSSTYLAAKDEFGLSEIDRNGDNNNPYGFGSGVFPFFSYIENGQYASGAVIYNDSVGSDLIVSDSYYTAERVANLPYTNTVIKGKQLTEDDVSRRGSYVGWNHDSADKIYEGILNSFLDYALPKVTFNF